MTITTSGVIYEPRGAAREYAPLAVNLYGGCEHRCKYCYAPAVLRRTPEAFAKVSPRPGIIPALEKKAHQVANDPRPILLCFTCDPYPAGEATWRITRSALGILTSYNCALRVLTKNPGLALKLDGKFFAEHDVELGTTIVFLDDAKRAEWEPGAPTIASRVAALVEYKRLGLRTWVSVEPVIDPHEALDVIALLAPHVDVWKVGRWNHDVRANAIDWPAFTKSALALLTRLNARYYIKNELWKSAGMEATAGYEKDNLLTPAEERGGR
jgi:DNA repair photolyase